MNNFLMGKSILKTQIKSKFMKTNAHFSAFFRYHIEVSSFLIFLAVESYSLFLFFTDFGITSNSFSSIFASFRIMLLIFTIKLLPVIFIRYVSFF